MQRLKWRRSAERAQVLRRTFARALQEPSCKGLRKRHTSHAQTERSKSRHSGRSKATTRCDFRTGTSGSLQAPRGQAFPAKHVMLSLYSVWFAMKTMCQRAFQKEDPRNYVRKLENKQILARFLRFQPFIFSKRMQTPQISGSRGALPRFQEPLAYKILPHPAVEVALDPKTHPNSTRFHLEKLGILSTCEPETLQIKPSDTTRAPIATSGGRSKCTTSGCHFL